MTTIQVDSERHDWFPKMNLGDDYIGDEEGLCWDLPQDEFLRKGEKYYLLWGYPKPRFHTDPTRIDLSANRVILDPRSNLYRKLCNTRESGECDFAASVYLDENLVFFGVECKISIPLEIQVKPGVFYEYVQRSCVQLAFSQGYEKVKSAWNNGHMCAHPKMLVVILACCGNTYPLDPTRATPNTLYKG
mmetsp:Transcript_42728/g.51962  ORF Transcript_42728/g.51962 Transcript_42728/m.51962 type:complete len:189 (-) Transcript_42728:17-583(-)